MSQPQLEIQLIAAVTAAACALPGAFLVLRRMSLLSDAISHSILFGIVIAFIATRDLASPLLVAGAALTGVLTVSLVELIGNTRRVREDAAIGIVFPVLFSVGVILIARNAGDVHLDVDAVLLGELAFAPFDRMVAFGLDVGPRAFYLMGAILIVALAFIAAFYKELKLATFDAGLAASLGFPPAWIHYALVALVSVTAVGAFDAVGSVLVVALMIAPPAAARLLTDRLRVMLVLSATIGAASAVAGYWVAHALDASIAGSMAVMTGVAFLAAYTLAPDRGVVATARRRSRQRWEFAERMLAVHLSQHEGARGQESELTVEHLHDHFRWDRAFAARVVRHAERSGSVVVRGGRLHLTDAGRSRAREAVEE